VHWCIGLDAAAQSGVDVARADAGQKEEGVMSRAGVGMVVEELLIDENLRVRFALDPMETVADLFLRGVDLTRNEIDLFRRTDPSLWFLTSALSGQPQH
jgi:hypothetical protein